MRTAWCSSCAMELLTHSCHAVISFFWPEDGAGSSYLEHAARPPASGEGAAGTAAPPALPGAAAASAGGGRLLGPPQLTSSC